MPSPSSPVEIDLAARRRTRNAKARRGPRGASPASGRARGGRGRQDPRGAAAARSSSSRSSSSRAPRTGRRGCDEGSGGRGLGRTSGKKEDRRAAGQRSFLDGAEDGRGVSARAVRSFATSSARTRPSTRRSRRGRRPGALRWSCPSFPRRGARDCGLGRAGAGEKCKPTLMIPRRMTTRAARSPPRAARRSARPTVVVG